MHVRKHTNLGTNRIARGKSGNVGSVANRVYILELIEWLDCHLVHFLFACITVNVNHIVSEFYLCVVGAQHARQLIGSRRQGVRQIMGRAATNLKIFRHPEKIDFFDSYRCNVFKN